MAGVAHGRPAILQRVHAASGVLSILTVGGSCGFAPPIMLRLLPPLLSACALFLAGCSTQYKEWRGGGVQRGAGGAVEQIAGVDVWSMGRPNRPYQVIGIIEDSRLGAVVPMANRAGAVAREAKRSGGDIVIILRERKEYVGTYNTMNAHSSLNATTNFSATTDLYGRTAYTRGIANNSGSVSTFGSGVSMPVHRAHGQYEVSKYAGNGDAVLTSTRTGTAGKVRSDTHGTVHAD